MTQPPPNPWTPYCGAAPGPAELPARWNLDPWLLAALGLGALAYTLACRRGGARPSLFVILGGLALFVAFVSPLCALSSALFSARVAHHALLVTVAAPLFAFGLPGPRSAPPLAVWALAHAVAFWLWHSPAAYAWAFGHDGAYWLMQATLAGSAFGFWRAVRAAAPIAAAGGLLATMVQTGLLGALITFAAQPFYAPHLVTTWAWGLSPLADQQLAGLIMWAPMAAAYLLAALVLVGRGLAPTRAAA